MNCVQIQVGILIFRYSLIPKRTRGQSESFEPVKALAMIEKILHPKNLYKAYRQVVSNKGSSGVDGMSVYELQSYKDENRIKLMTSILNRKYVPQAIKGVEIDKSSGGVRLLGVPTVVDRWLQQAVSQQLSTKFELEFEPESYGFRPRRNIHQGQYSNP